MGLIPTWLKRVAAPLFGFIMGAIAFYVLPEDFTMGVILPLLILLLIGAGLELVLINRELKDLYKKIARRSELKQDVQ